MEICIAHIKNKAVMLSLKDDIVYIDGQEEAIMGITEEDLKEFTAIINAIPYTHDPGYKALVNAKRTVFLMKLIGHSGEDETTDKLSHILDSIHFEVLEYLNPAT